MIQLQVKARIIVTPEKIQCDIKWYCSIPVQKNQSPKFENGGSVPKAALGFRSSCATPGP